MQEIQERNTEGKKSCFGSLVKEIMQFFLYQNE